MILFIIVNRTESLQEGALGKFSVQSSFKLSLPPNLIIHSSSIKMTETIGQGI